MALSRSQDRTPVTSTSTRGANLLLSSPDSLQGTGVADREASSPRQELEELEASVFENSDPVAVAVQIVCTTALQNVELDTILPEILHLCQAISVLKDSAVFRIRLYAAEGLGLQLFLDRLAAAFWALPVCQRDVVQVLFNLVGPNIEARTCLLDPVEMVALKSTSYARILATALDESIKSFGQGDESWEAFAARVLTMSYVFTADEDFTTLFAQESGIQHLINLIDSPMTSDRNVALGMMVLSEFCQVPSYLQTWMRRNPAFVPITIKCLRSQSMEMMYPAACCVGLACWSEPALANKMTKAGAFQRLIQLISNEHFFTYPDVAVKAIISATVALLCVEENMTTLIDNNTHELIFSYLITTEDWENAGGFFYFLSDCTMAQPYILDQYSVLPEDVVPLDILLDAVVVHIQNKNHYSYTHFILRSSLMAIIALERLLRSPMAYIRSHTRAKVLSSEFTSTLGMDLSEFEFNEPLLRMRNSGLPFLCTQDLNMALTHAGVRQQKIVEASAQEYPSTEFAIAFMLHILQQAIGNDPLEDAKEQEGNPHKFVVVRDTQGKPLSVALPVKSSALTQNPRLLVDSLCSFVDQSMDKAATPVTCPAYDFFRTVVINLMDILHNLHKKDIITDGEWEFLSRSYEWMDSIEDMRDMLLCIADDWHNLDCSGKRADEIKRFHAQKTIARWFQALMSARHRKFMSQLEKGKGKKASGEPLAPFHSLGSKQVSPRSDKDRSNGLQNNLANALLLQSLATRKALMVQAQAELNSEAYEMWNSFWNSGWLNATRELMATVEWETTYRHDLWYTENQFRLAIKTSHLFCMELFAREAIELDAVDSTIFEQKLVEIEQFKVEEKARKEREREMFGWEEENTRNFIKKLWVQKVKSWTNQMATIPRLGVQIEEQVSRRGLNEMQLSSAMLFIASMEESARKVLSSDLETRSELEKIEFFSDFKISSRSIRSSEVKSQLRPVTASRRPVSTSHTPGGRRESIFMSPEVLYMEENAREKMEAEESHNRLLIAKLRTRRGLTKSVMPKTSSMEFEVDTEVLDLSIGHLSLGPRVRGKPRLADMLMTTGEIVDTIAPSRRAKAVHTSKVSKLGPHSNPASKYKHVSSFNSENPVRSRVSPATWQSLNSMGERGASSFSPMDLSFSPYKNLSDYKDLSRSKSNHASLKMPSIDKSRQTSNDWGDTGNHWHTLNSVVV